MRKIHAVEIPDVAELEVRSGLRHADKVAFFRQFSEVPAVIFFEGALRFTAATRTLLVETVITSGRLVEGAALPESLSVVAVVVDSPAGAEAVRNLQVEEES